MNEPPNNDDFIEPEGNVVVYSDEEWSRIRRAEQVADRAHAKARGEES